MRVDGAAPRPGILVFAVERMSGAEMGDGDDVPTCASSVAARNWVSLHGMAGAGQDGGDGDGGVRTDCM